jgi:hypothetical protein
MPRSRNCGRGGKERLGKTLAGEVMKTSGLVKLGDDLPLRAASKSMRLPARRWPNLEQAQRALEHGEAALETAR